MEIRERRDDDLDALVSMAARVHQLDNYPPVLPGGDLVRFLTHPTPATAWVAVHAGAIVGHVALNDTTSRPVMELVAKHSATTRPAYVARLLVDPRSRREGVGRRLLEQARRAAIDNGRHAYLDVVDSPSATPAIALYRAAGWQQVGRVPFDLADERIDELIFRAPRAATHSPP